MVVGVSVGVGVGIVSAGVTGIVAIERGGVWDFDVSHHFVISQACRLGYSGMRGEMVLTTCKMMVLVMRM